MAISFVANALGATNSTTSFSITLPATQAGDIIILEFAHRGPGNGTIGGTYSGPAFTLKHSQLFGSSAFSGKTYYSRAAGNHLGQTVTGSGLTNSCAAIVTVYRGAVGSGDPLADATIVGEQNASGNETQAQITTTTNGAWVVLVVVNSPDLGVSSQNSTSPGVLTERAERLSTGGTDSSVSHASAAKATAGATGSLTWSQTNAASGSWAYAIKPDTAQIISVGQALETDEVLVLGKAKAKATGLISETDEVLALTRVKTRTTGLPEETDSSFAVGRLKTLVLGLSGETDTATAMVTSQTVPVGLVEETDSVLALVRIKSKLLGLPEETDEGFAIGRAKIKALGLSEEADVALAASGRRSYAVGLATEADSGFIVGRLKTLLVGLVIEADSAFPVTMSSMVAGVAKFFRNRLGRGFLSPGGR